MAFDPQLFRLLNGLAGHSKILDVLGIFFADTLAYILAAAVVVVLFLEKNWKKRLRDFFEVALATIISWGLLTQIIRFIYNRPRPPLALENVKVLLEKNLQESSFPSGHAVFFFALAIVMYSINKKWAPYFLAGAILMGAARVFVGVHYPADILAGVVVGWFGAWAARKLVSSS